MCSPGPLHGPLHHPRLSTCSGFFVAAPWLMKVMMMVTMVTIVFLVMMVVLTVVLMVIMVIYGDYVEKLSINSARDAFLRLTHWHLDTFGTVSCRYCYSHSVGADQALILLDRASKLDIFAQNRRLRTSPCVCLGVISGTLRTKWRTRMAPRSQVSSLPPLFPRQEKWTMIQRWYSINIPGVSKYWIFYP